MDIRISWDEYFIILAKFAALRYTCVSRPVGAVLVKGMNIIATGYNGSVVNGDHCTDDGLCYRRSINVKDSNKSDYCRSTHAEANVIAQAARNGIGVEGAVIYTTLQPCYTCFKLIINSGIRKVYYEYVYESIDKERDIHWRKEIKKYILLEWLNVSDYNIKKTIAGLSRMTSERRLESE